MFIVENMNNAANDDFRRKLKEEWSLLWKERFDDKYRAEGVAIQNYPLLLMDRGCVIFASRNAATPSFPQIVEYWAAKNCLRNLEPTAGGWGKFVRTIYARRSERRMSADPTRKHIKKQQLKKGGRGWLHRQ
jgi:hypothetical protein